MTTKTDDLLLTHLTRRAFLRGLLAAAGSGVLAACAPGQKPAQPFAGSYNTATPARVMASPRAPSAVSGAQDGTPTPESGAAPQDGGLALQQFLTLSAVLTGVQNLDPVVGSVYLQSLQSSDEFDVTLGDLYERAGFETDAPPDSIVDLQEQGFFEPDASNGSAASLADTIIEYWYTGVYTTPEGEQAVATYVDALAWKALSFTKPNSICGSPGFWEERPEVTLRRD